MVVESESDDFLPGDLQLAFDLAVRGNAQNGKLRNGWPAFSFCRRLFTGY